MKKVILYLSGLWAAFFLCGLFSLCGNAQDLNLSKSIWVYKGLNDRLVYKALERGDKIMDFSYAGYLGGGIKIPDPAVKVAVSPVSGDNTASIQKAIDFVSNLPLKDGFRGTVLLHRGVYDCSSTLTIHASGVVLRGSGSDEHGTIINMTGKAHNCIGISGHSDMQIIGIPTLITDNYVPSGTNTFRLADISGFSVGDTIRISRPVTPAWVQFMGMDKLIRNGKKQTWITGEITIERVVKKINGHQVTVDVPLSDNYDLKYLNPPGVSVVKISNKGLLSQVGIENFRILSPAESVTINQGHNRAFSMSNITDGWARDITIYNTVNSVSITGKRITVDNINIVHEVPTIGAAKPADINGSGSQLLFNRCHIRGSNLFFFATGAKVSGPVVLLNCLFQDSGWIQPHQRWSTGLLIDNCKVPDGGIDFMNRGEYGSGHGWAIGWAVAWNCEAKSLLNQRPPGSANWMIGCIGEKQRKSMPFNKSPLLPDGFYDAYGTPVDPSSLYLAQLSERLGRQAVKNIGY